MKRLIITKLCAVAFLVLSFILLSAWWESNVVVLPDHDYLPQIEELYEEQRYGEALALAEEVLSMEGMPNHDEIEAFIPEIERAKASYVRKTKDALKGAISGEGDTGSMLVGSMVADAFVFGDIRDLSIEAWHKFRGRDADEFVVLLSVVGIGASAATLFPEPSSTAAGATVQAGATTLKVLKKSDALSPTLVKSLKKSLRAAKAEKDLGLVKDSLYNVGVLVKQSPDGSLISVFKRIDDPKDLDTVAHWMRESPNTTVAVLEAGGERGMKWMRAGNLPGSKATEAILRKGAAGFTKARWISRPVKFVATGGLIHMQEFMRDVFMQHPILRILGAIVGVVLLLFGTILGLPKKFVVGWPIRQKYEH